MHAFVHIQSKERKCNFFKRQNGILEICELGLRKSANVYMWYIFMCVSMKNSAWRPREDIRCPALSLSIIIPGDRVSGSRARLVAVRSQWSSCLYSSPHSAGWLFTQVPEIWNQSFVLVQKCFPQWAFSLAQCHTVLMIVTAHWGLIRVKALHDFYLAGTLPKKCFLVESRGLGALWLFILAEPSLCW